MSSREDGRPQKDLRPPRLSAPAAAEPPVLLTWVKRAAQKPVPGIWVQRASRAWRTRSPSVTLSMTAYPPVAVRAEGILKKNEGIDFLG